LLPIVIVAAGRFAVGRLVPLPEGAGKTKLAAVLE